jgi:dihydroorotate dehydrogenase electron transfer subunit
VPPLAETAAVVASEQVSATLWLLHLDAPHVAAQARPGQFVLARCADPEFPVADPYLPRAYFVFASDSQGSRLSVLVERRGSGSAWLCSRQPGHRLLVHGPAGREVRPARLTRNLLLLAEGTDAVAGLARLASDSSRRGLSVTLVENVPAGQEGVPARLLSPDVEYRTTSPEAGGLLGALPPLIRWADEVIVAASPDVLELLATLRRSHLEPFTLHAGVPVQAAPLAWLGGPDGWLRRGGDFLPCGAGWCGACAVSARTGRRLFCREGPVWPLEELRFAGHDAAQDDGAADATPVP